MNLPEFGVKRPVTNLMIFFCILVLAIYSLTRLGIDMMPKIEPPAITVVSVYSGASPEDVEIKVTEPLENQLATINGLEKITSRSGEGVSIITLKFSWGTNIDEASNDIRDRIELVKPILPDIPDEMENPFIFKFNTALIPILIVGVTAKESLPDLYDIVDKTVADPLRQLPGVGTVQMQGGLQRQINIWIDRQRLEGYGFSILDIQNALRMENVTQPLGNIKSGLTDYLIRLPGEFISPEEINSIILGKRNSNFVYLKDLARVEDSFKEVVDIVRVNKNSGLIMIIQKQTGTNTVQVASLVKKKLKTLENTLPSDVKIGVIMDTSRDIIVSLKSLQSTIWFASLLVILVVWFFLRRFLPSLIIALTIPFSAMISFIYLFLSGKTINVISLSSVTIAIGMIVDNAIVVVDNVYRHLERGRRPQEASIYGTSEMFLAISASTFTTVVVFLPMLFITGVIGIMFGELAVVVTVALLASLFTAVTFSPMLCARWLRVSKGETNSEAKNKKSIFGLFYAISERWFTVWENGYSAALAWGLRHKKIIIFGFFTAFILSIFLIPFVGTEFIPEEDSGDVRITGHLAVGTRIEESDKIARRLEDIFEKEVPETQTMFARVGQATGMGRVMGQASGSHIVTVGAKLVPKDQRKRSAKGVGQVIRGKMRAIAGMLSIDILTGNPIGRILVGTSGKGIQIEIIGHSFEETNALAAKIKSTVEKVPGATDVSISREFNRPELRITVDREKAVSLGLNMRSIADTMKTYIEGSTATKYREKGETYDIYVRLEEFSRAKIQDIENLTIVSTYTGKQVRLTNFAKVEEIVGPVDVERQNRERVLRVECDAYGRSMGKVVEDIKKQLQNIVIPSDITISFGGEVEEQIKAFKDLTLLLILGIILVYMVMAAQFESLLDPFVVMFAIPFTFTGVILGFLFTNTTLSIVTFLGIIMLMGIVVNNAIVLVSYINILRARGLSMLEAVTTGGRERLRPVLMTTITTLVGLFPLAVSRGEGSETWQPLGITMISGLLVSTLITMIFVPTFYATIEGWLERRKGRRKK